MIEAESICQEFCDEVVVASRGAGVELALSQQGEELKCRLQVKYFSALMERMVQAGYCCTQVQKDLRSLKCTAWFEPANSEEIV